MDGSASSPSPAPSLEGFRPAPPAVLAVVNRLMTTLFTHLATARLVIAIRERAEDVGEGKVMVAGAGVNPKADEFDYIIWVAWDVWQLIDDGDREALLFHELTHCERDEAGMPTIKPHDAGVFNEEVKRYGMWWEDAQRRFKSARSTQ